MILRTLCDYILNLDQKLYATFIDYSSAFDTVSHRFLDRALAEAKATDKSRAVFRSIYGAATANTKVQDTDGKQVYSDTFPINRGVLQGDITSPLYFILALELILKLHDTHPSKGVDFGGRQVHTLGYADDCALLDTTLETATERVTAIAKGSKDDADVSINISKTDSVAGYVMIKYEIMHG